MTEESGTLRFSARAHPSPEGTRVVLDGELDLPAVRLAVPVFDEVDLTLPVEIDASGLRFLDSSGLRTLLVVVRRAREAGGRVVLTHPQPAVLRVLELTGVLDRFGAPADGPVGLRRPAHREALDELRALVRGGAPPHEIAGVMRDAVGDGCVLSTVRDDVVTPIAFVHARRGAEAVFAESMPPSLHTSESSILEDVVRRLQPVFPDMPPSSVMRVSDAYRERVGIAALGCVPVVRAGRAVGTVGVTRDAGRPSYDEDDRALVCAAALVLRGWPPFSDTDGDPSARSATTSTATSSSH